jgi:hypothetical protein
MIIPVACESTALAASGNTVSLAWFIGQPVWVIFLLARCW